MSQFSDLLGRIRNKLDPDLVSLLDILAAGESSRDFAAKVITAVLTGNVTGNVVGDLDGDAVLDALVCEPAAMTESAAVPAASFVRLNSATPAIAATIVPTAGQFLIITQADSGTAGHTLTTAGTFDGTNNTATFDAQHETLVLFALSATRWVIVANIGSVGLSAVG